MSAEHADNAFLGIGWAFPPAFNSGTCSAVLVTDQQDIEQSLRILFSTHPGERVIAVDHHFFVSHIQHDDRLLMTIRTGRAKTHTNFTRMLMTNL